MAAGLALSAVQTLLAAVQCTTQLKELSSMFEYKSQLDKLESTVKTIKAVFLEAETKDQELTPEGRVWFEELKDAVYDADDFFDELNTRAQLQKLSPKKVFKKVRRFLSRENQLVSAFHTSQKIKMLRENLDCIADDHKNFGFSGVYKPVKRREETCSYVFDPNVIGRDEEKKDIVDELLSDLTSSVSFLSIVGMGGLGKTTLAKLVYNDERIKDTFGEDLHWVCVSEEFSFKEILCKLLGNNDSKCTLEVLQKEVRKKIEGRRYLLVLDDVWEETPHNWHELKDFLLLGGTGSRILVTTRSEKVAKVVNKDLVFMLEGLSEEDSWHLFKKIAFGDGDDHDSRLVSIGRDIVKKCANVPLSIKVISSLLYGEDESKWEAFRNLDLANMSYLDTNNQIMSTLLYSYYHLTPALKSCFSFCSLFNKDCEIEKESLISLWMAEGYLVPRIVGESMEDVGVEYFLILLQRCFFQDVHLDEYGEISNCKMHDLMHDVALKVAGKESLTLMDSKTQDLEKKFRHLSITCDEPIDSLYNKDCPSRKALRTFVHFNSNSSSMNVNLVALVSNFKRLRVLHLSCDMELCPNEIGKLLHLRYLRICGSSSLKFRSSLKFLPTSITKLQNLQILNIISFVNLIELPHNIEKLVNLRILYILNCSKLKKLPEGIGNLVSLRILRVHECDELTELPKDIGKLVDLKVLDMVNCYLLNKLQRDEFDDILYSTRIYNKKVSISSMPIGINKLRNIHTLSYFVVGGDSSLKVQKGELIDLKDLNLRGHLRIDVLGISPSDKPNSTKRAHILKEAHLKGLEIFCECTDDQGEFQKVLLEGLSPNNELEALVMRGYQGVIFPNWGEGKILFPFGIVRMVLAECVAIKHLSSLSKLVNLKFLCLSKMENLEYIEKDAADDMSETFFPSLEILMLVDAQKLEGWWRDITWNDTTSNGGSGCLVDANNNRVELLPSFTRLRVLRIRNCENLKYFPPCPHLKELFLGRVNEALHFCGQRNTYLNKNLITNTTPSTSSSSSYLFSSHPTLFCLENLILRDADEFYNSPFLRGRLGNISYLKTLVIWGRENLECLGEDEDKEGMPWKSLTSLSYLQLWGISSLEKLPKGFQYLTSLQSLMISNCPKLEVEGIMWNSLHSLSSLKLISLSKLVNLPKDFQHLSSLQSLIIQFCENLEGLGESIGSLTSLQSLYIWVCPKVKSLPEAMCRLTSLTKLSIHKSSSSLKERCQEPDGEDWPKICHIPHLSIYE